MCSYFLPVEVQGTKVSSNQPDLWLQSSLCGAWGSPFSLLNILYQKLGLVEKVVE